MSLSIIRGGGSCRVVGVEVTRSEAAELETPELRRVARSPVEIVVPRFVDEVMRDECWTLTRSDGREVGGYLFATTPRRRDKSIRLFHASGTANAFRTSDSMQLDADEQVRASRWIARNGWDDTEVVGIWHSHPGGTDGKPSTADLRAFLRTLDWHAERGRPAAFSASLILYPNRDGMWGGARVDGWITRREGYGGRPVTEPATVRRV